MDINDFMTREKWLFFSHAKDERYVIVHGRISESNKHVIIKPSAMSYVHGSFSPLNHLWWAHGHLWQKQLTPSHTTYLYRVESDKDGIRIDLCICAYCFRQYIVSKSRHRIRKMLLLNRSTLLLFLLLNVW